MLCLSINGFEVEPSRITEILGIQPTTVQRRGETSPVTGRPFRKSQWILAFEEKVETFDDHAFLLDKIISIVSDKCEQFLFMRGEVKPESVSIYGGMYLKSGGQHGIGLTVTQMKALSECEIDWGVDIFG